ncbi:MAG: CDP-archaeol synthase [Gammaproteobacteria bacterium]|nr:MAG: CDP-archaeol synthase [Gammaproteobacteria bacterium]
MDTTPLVVLALILAANGAPVLAARLLPASWRPPIDGGLRLADGRPLFGRSKTWAGILAALLASGTLAVLLGIDLQNGLLLGALAMAGDLFSSFVKRRIGLEPHARALGLDQVPEALFPSLGSMPLLGLDWADVLLVTLAFAALELALSRLGYRLGIRRHPY